MAETPGPGASGTLPTDGRAPGGNASSVGSQPDRIAEPDASARHGPRAAGVDTAALRRALFRRTTAAAVILALATVGTAWSAYQSTRWSGEMAQSYSEANALRAESVRASTSAGQLEIVDVSGFTAWSQAVGAANTGLAAFLRARFRPEFATAFDAWLGRPPGTTSAPSQVPPGTPFDSYRPALFATSDKLAASATAAFEDAKRANQNGDDHVLLAVIFATVLFFAGIADNLGSAALERIFLTWAGIELVGAILLAFVWLPQSVGI